MEKQTIRLDWATGPLVIDVWEPPAPTDIPPLLLLHGWGASGFYWAKTAQALAASARVIIPDLPGTGRSQPVRGAQDLFDQVATVSELLDGLKLERVQIVGHSMGGAMALLLAADRPQQIERLVLTSTCFFMNMQQVQVYRTVMQFSFLAMHFRPGWLLDVPGMAHLAAKRYFHRVPDDPALLREGLLAYLQLDYDTAVACAKNASDPAIPAAGARVQCPTLLIACRQDEVMPVENVDYTSQVIPHCTVRWIEECGHLPMVERPDVYLAILRGFLHL